MVKEQVKELVTKELKIVENWSSNRRLEKEEINRKKREY